MKFKLWYQYFQVNQDHFANINWSQNEVLTSKEKRSISSSIRQFQKGEHSEGKHFLQFAKEMNDDSYTNAVKLFIKEEQDHALVLGKFMAMQKIKTLKKDWLDNTFRWLRKIAGLEGTITVLLTAEIISMVYYKALHKATASKLLQQICNQILIDEKMHLRFQNNALQTLYEKKSYIAIQFSGFLHNTLMVGTIIMVWIYHKKVLQAGGYNFFSFYGDVWKEFKMCRKMIVSATSFNYGSSLNFDSKDLLNKYLHEA